MPWRLLESSDAFVGFLVAYSSLLAPVLGVIVSHPGGRFRLFSIQADMACHNSERPSKLANKQVQTPFQLPSRQTACPHPFAHPFAGR